MQFKIGELVTLKSGGPKMTVAEVSSDGDDWIRISWFVGEELHSEFMHSASVRIAEHETQEKPAD